MGMAAAWPPAALAQQDSSRHMPTVGFMGFATAEADAPALQHFRKGLSDLGYVEGRTIYIDARSANGDVARGLAIIDEFAAKPVDVLLSPGPAAARAAVRKTKIPVVAVALPAVQSDPELFQSLARPGGTLTGFAAFGEEMSSKRIQMLREILPELKTLGVMNNATDPTFSAWGAQTMLEARSAGMEPMRLGLTAASPAAVSEQIKVLADAGGAAMVVIRDYMTSAMRDEICHAGIERKIAVVGEQAEFARAGALLSYGADIGDLFRRAAGYVDLILKGRKPAEMPIQLPTKFELVVNLKTARVLGLTIPPSILVLTDDVIE
ncbi:ABC transporter substrate-binding protein [Bradyrhizobium sp. WYCCWR 13023]|uniref:ABC transporter substrate-binding protein n=1 Tax=Bradyrhizobium zhengyangense TaxID=2911009 RepID=A0A9X1UG64_9BRAD|nr:ABC transporter substrate-binding protein [Bradyrhizobium zhengyangense]MCG2627197.1 ABC transporter substrate-binding protein [Bradyrhizobium zhengyangense]MCG2642145.1 ABC transporter substrate-binding protein [Bradyrhizobium zhengyangense]MCG2667944.1 ABC transporter substrate-binding protein [Bradyrhizobium zhengyangense]